MDFFRELWSVLKSRKKLWLLPIILVLLLLGGLIVFVQGSAIAPFIYTVFCRAHPRPLRVLSRQRRRADRGRRDHRRRAGRTFLPEKTLRRFPGRGRALLSRASGSGAGRDRPYRLLRQASAQIRAPARDLSRLRPGGISLIRHRHAGVAQGKALSKTSNQRRTSEDRSRGRCAREIIVQRTPPLSHAASAFYPSPFDRALVLT